MWNCDHKKKKKPQRSHLSTVHWHWTCERGVEEQWSIPWSEHQPCSQKSISTDLAWGQESWRGDSCCNSTAITQRQQIFFHLSCETSVARLSPEITPTPGLNKPRWDRWRSVQPSCCSVDSATACCTISSTARLHHHPSSRRSERLRHPVFAILQVIRIRAHHSNRACVYSEERLIGRITWGLAKDTPLRSTRTQPHLTENFLNCVWLEITSTAQKWFKVFKRISKKKKKRQHVSPYLPSTVSMETE